MVAMRILQSGNCTNVTFPCAPVVESVIHGFGQNMGVHIILNREYSTRVPKWCTSYLGL